MVNSIAKGKSFERQVVKLLSNSTNSIWKRVPMSGAFSTVNKSNDSRFYGDVFSEDKQFSDIVVECKKTKAPITITEIFNPKSRLIDWVIQTRTESKNNPWVLIFSWNNSKIFYLSENKETLERLNLNNFINYDKYFLGILNK